MPPRAFTSAIVSSSSKEMQSQSRFPPGDCRSKARWPIANSGSVPIPRSCGASSSMRLSMISLQSFERRPFLAGVTDELPFIFANWTARRRFRSLSKLRPALHADKVFHRKIIDAVCFSDLRNTSFIGTEIISDVTLPVGVFHETKCRSAIFREKSPFPIRERAQFLRASQMVWSRSPASSL